MAFVQKAVARLYEPDKLETLLRDLGKKHYHYGATQKYVDVCILNIIFKDPKTLLY